MGLVEYEQDKFAALISEITQIVFYDRKTQKIEGIKNPSGSSKYFGIKVQVG
jgi:hypothetical protein